MHAASRSPVWHRCVTLSDFPRRCTLLPVPPCDTAVWRSVTSLVGARCFPFSRVTPLCDAQWLPSSVQGAFRSPVWHRCVTLSDFPRRCTLLPVLPCDPAVWRLVTSLVGARCFPFSRVTPLCDAQWLPSSVQGAFRSPVWHRCVTLSDFPRRCTLLPVLPCDPAVWRLVTSLVGARCFPFSRVTPLCDAQWLPSSVHAASRSPVWHRCVTLSDFPSRCTLLPVLPCDTAVWRLVTSLVGARCFLVSRVTPLCDA